MATVGWPMCGSRPAMAIVGGMFLRALGETGTNAAKPWLHGHRSRALCALAALTVAVVLAACGGGTPQDATEPVGNFQVQVTRASFPTKQQLSATTDLQLAIKNTGDKALPDLAITIYTGNGAHPQADGSFSTRIDDPSLANPSRPVWILENEYPKLLGKGVTVKNLDSQPTAGAAAAQTDTYQFGSIPPGHVKAVDWRVTPTKPGTYTVHYQVAAGLQGNAKAVTSDGSPVQGQFVVTIGAKPPQTCVSGSGQVVQGNCQLSASK
ncbi:MAG: hypothetical protein QOJ01_1052 [Solirubrobacterales bacterium]|nr:hypothetical protein [Solirubrobacterales bacterium]